MDIRPFFRGPHPRFAELIITSENFDELFIPERHGTGRRLRPLEEIPREYFLDGHHPLDGDYLHITTKFDAHVFNSPVESGWPYICLDCDDPVVTITAEIDMMVLNWDSFVASEGSVWLNSVDIGQRSDECHINPDSTVIYNPQRGDWVGYYNSQYVPRGIGGLYSLEGESTRVRQIYVDATSVRARFRSNCITDRQISSATRRAYEYNLANGIRRFLLENTTARPAPFTQSCSMDRHCANAARYWGLEHTFEYVCIGDSEFEQGTCMHVIPPERLMMTPEALVVVTADDRNSPEYALASARNMQDCAARNISDPRTGQIGNPSSRVTPSSGPTTSGFSRYIGPISADAEDTNTVDPRVGEELLRCQDGSCFYDPNQQIRPSLAERMDN
jgi:hypothetical protein